MASKNKFDFEERAAHSCGVYEMNFLFGEAQFITGRAYKMIGF
jgi:hypothetical protein